MRGTPRTPGTLPRVGPMPPGVERTVGSRPEKAYRGSGGRTTNHRCLRDDMGASDRFIVLQRDRHALDPIELAKALAEIRGTPIQDQVVAARGTWGLVAEGLSGQEAKALATALGEAGIPCAVGPTRAVVELPPVEPASALEDLPSRDPLLIAVAGIEVTTRTKTRKPKGPSGAQKAASAAILLTTGLPIKVGGRKRKVETTRDERTLSFHADLHYRDPSRRLRIDPSHFDFSFLGERMLYQAQGNLKLLVARLVARTPEAWLNHGARVLLEGRPVRTMGYRSMEDLDREARWLLTLDRFGLSGGPGT